MTLWFSFSYSIFIHQINFSHISVKCVTLSTACGRHAVDSDHTVVFECCIKYKELFPYWFLYQCCYTGYFVCLFSCIDVCERVLWVHERMYWEKLHVACQGVDDWCKICNNVMVQLNICNWHFVLECVPFVFGVLFLKSKENLKCMCDAWLYEDQHIDPFKAFLAYHVLVMWTKSSLKSVTITVLFVRLNSLSIIIIMCNFIL